jgi:rsbT antagonist protein RsbS
VLSRLAAAASLMGARTIISGMKPEIAMALETMGIKLENVTTTLDLETALDVLGVRRPGSELDETDDLDDDIEHGAPTVASPPPRSGLHGGGE